MRTVAMFLILLASASAQPKASGDGFAQWLPQFRTAVAKADVKAVAAGARWPMQWENGSTREIPAEAELAKRFTFYFTSEIRKQIASGKPESLGENGYSITWKARGNEYSIYFKQTGGTWALDGLSEGPP